MSNLQVGFARLDMTPPLGVPMSGYFFERRVEGIRDPLYISAIAVRDGEKTCIAMNCDHLGFRNGAMEAWLPKIAAAAGVEEEALFVACTHTHTGPVNMGDPIFGSDEQYDAWVERRLCDAAVMAVNDCANVEQMLTYEGVCPGVTFTRRLKMKDGHYQTWATECDPEIEGWAAEADESLRFVRFIRTNAEEIVLVNFQGHADNVSGNRISADYPGFLRARVEAARPGTKLLYFTGAQGNLIMRDYWKKSVPTEKYTCARITGHKLADFVLAHWDEASPAAGGGVAFGQQWVNCRTKRDSSRVPEAQRIVDIHEHGDEEKEIGPDWIATPMVAEAYRILNLEKENLDTVDLRVSAVSFGGFAMVGITGEPFCELGQYIRDNSPYPFTFMCAIANGSGDYFPNAIAYDQGGYEPANTRFIKGTGEIVAETCVELLKKLHG